MIFHACSQNLVRPSFWLNAQGFLVQIGQRPQYVINVHITRSNDRFGLNILFANIQIIIYLRHYKRIYFQRCSDAIENKTWKNTNTLSSAAFPPSFGVSSMLQNRIRHNYEEQQNRRILRSSHKYHLRYSPLVLLSFHIQPLLWHWVNSNWVNSNRIAIVGVINRLYAVISITISIYYWVNEIDTCRQYCQYSQHND